MFKKLIQRLQGYYPALVGLGMFLVSLVLRNFPEQTHQIYRNRLFSGFRWVHDAIFGYLPFPMIAAVLILGAAAAIYVFFTRRHFYRPFYRPILNILGILITWFYITWGFNYSATDVKTMLELSPTTLTENQKTQLLNTSLGFAQAARMLSDTNAFFHSDASNMLPAIHSSVREELRRIGFETPGNVTMRRISETGWLRRIGISGIYLPFSGEAHADASYLPLRSWFIMAHEYSHGYGITTEGECDFIAFMALKNSGVPELEYAAWFEMANSVRMPRADSLAFDSLPAFFRRDLDTLRADIMNYPPWFGKTAHYTNDLYLKINGIEEGIASYNLLPSYFIATGYTQVEQK